MKISTSMDHGIDRGLLSPVQTAQLMRAVGFDAIDLDMSDCGDRLANVFSEKWRHGVLAVADAAHRAGLAVGQCHLLYHPSHIAPPGNGSYKDFEEYLLPALKSTIALAGEAGCPVAVLHPYYELHDEKASFDGNLLLIEKLLPALEESGVRLALENIYGLNYADVLVSSGEGIAEILNTIDLDCVGACIDTGHSNIFGRNISEMARLYGKRLFALHVNGNAGKDSHCIPYTMSGWTEKTDYHDFVRTLREIGYAGTFNLELSCGDMPASVVPSYYAYASAMARALSNEYDI